ncbi:diguanylate cyclase [Acidovorax sp. Root217]|uniref:diguanylate cyclase n=1 Tax=Acidovorax sp. Root217 TaxID=1736492 RepID=UPI000710A079|nr:diguanylate cyclase [Acidovorax sp. Root217]KRC24729.1 diguanylate cyclase [Acidovorax sp. Root217]
MSVLHWFMRSMARRAAMACVAALCLLMLPTLPVHAATPLVLGPDTQSLDAWKVITVQADASRELTVHDMLGRIDRFDEPARRGGALGLRQEAMWMHFPLVTPATFSNQWIVNIDYSSLLEVDFYLARDGEVLQHSLQGYQRAPGKEAGASRTPAMALDLQPGQRYDVLIRVRTLGPMTLPITVSEMPHRLKLALREQMLQGLLNGLAFWLLLYSLLQWVGQRDRLFAYYALVVFGSATFSLQFFGIGVQFLWPGNAWMEGHSAIIAGLLALAGSFLFLGHALASDAPQGRYARTMQGCAVITTLVCLAFLLDLLSVRAANVYMTLFGLLPTVLSIPAALRQTRRGDPVGGTLLVAWTVYAVGAGTIGALSQGLVPANFWTLHAFQFGATVDMLLFLRVLGLRSEALRKATLEALRERDAMRSLAHTDPLTGLPNRRGMQIALKSALEQCTPQRMVAVFLLDLDGFKPVNDTHGHDVGDDLLVAVGQRLQNNMRRQTDMVARPGGDEFIILATELTRPEQAREIGEGLLQAFREPFTLRNLRVGVGLTIGYVLAPFDGKDVRELINKADAAMYKGKQTGKHCLLRGDGPMALAS